MDNEGKDMPDNLIEMVLKDLGAKGLRGEFTPLIIWFMTGWIGYWTAYHDFPKPQGWALFSAWFVYSLPYLVILEWIDKMGYSKAWLLAALPFSFLLGAFWAVVGRKWLTFLLGKLKISNETGRAGLIDDIKVAKVSAITITLQDGRELCSDMGIDDARKATIKSGRIDKQGNMCLYVDFIKNPDEKEYTEMEVSGDNYDLLTYIPVQEIKMVHFSITKREPKKSDSKTTDTTTDESD